MRYRVTITTTHAMLPTVIQVLTDSCVSDFRVEPVEETISARSRPRSKLNGRGQPHSSVNIETPLRQAILAVIKANPGLTAIEIASRLEIEGYSDVKASTYSTLSYLNHKRILKREKNGNLYCYRLAFE
jgi:hypothetical protein